MKCPICNQASDRPANHHHWLVHHLLDHHAWLFLHPSRSATWHTHCIACPQTFFVEANFAIHARANHTSEELLAAVHAQLLNIQPQE